MNEQYRINVLCQIVWTEFTLPSGYFEILPITVSSQTFPKMFYIVSLATHFNLKHDGCLNNNNKSGYDSQKTYNIFIIKRF